MAFYTRIDANTFESHEHTRGPWSADAQHAGPPAALLGHAVEATARPGMRVARLTFDIARPVPLEPLTVTTSVQRQGRSVAVIEAAIEPYIRCTAMLIRTGEDLAPSITDGVAPPLAQAHPEPFFPVAWEVGYHTATEAVFNEGSFFTPGPATGWLRMLMPLIEGEPITPLSRVLVAADSGNGLSSELDFRKHLFVNTDLTVHLVRYPVGEWVCLQGQTSIDSAGIGLADTALFDESGRIGRSAQSLFVSPS